MFIVSLNYTCGLEKVDQHLDAHIAYLKQEYANGSFIASGRKVPRTGGIILSCLKDRKELASILARDPFSEAGIAEYEITEFVPSMIAKGFEILQP
ncbi:MAG: YciI family protein [Desulfobacteraceae bacterium]|nr:YciI family protein [Desulfobacteraceae bacterium]